MPEPTQKELLNRIDLAITELQRLKVLVRDIVPMKEWYSTAEFAAKTGLTKKTIQNYCGWGKYGDNQRKDSSGKWEIHHSEING